MGENNMSEENQQAKWRAWAISLLLHGIVFLLVAATGFFLAVRPAEKTVPENTVWLDSPAGAAGGGGKAPAASAPAAMEVAMPPAADLPAITEDYTRHPEKKKDYRKQHQVTKAGTKRESSDSGSAAGENSGSAGTGGGNSSGAGTGNGNGAGNGADGNGAGSGTGKSQEEREPARCIAKASPEYPSSLRSQNAEGVVALLIYVQDGSVTNVAVTSSSGYGAMDQAAIAAGYRCQFRGSGVYPIRYRFQMIDGDDW